MCLYPKLIKNRKYVGNKKNGGLAPVLKDSRTAVVAVGCGKCMECRKQKAREWQVRLMEDIKDNRNGKFVTMTFSNEAIAELDGEVDEEENEILNRQDKEGYEGKRIKGFSTGYERDNRIAAIGVRRWLERYRKHNGVSIRHWLITEIGGHGSENIHLHGIVWTEETLATMEKYWQYGYIWKGQEKNGRIQNYVNEKTINYITKYVTKVDKKHEEYRSKILTSAGIGRGYTDRLDAQRNKYDEKGTKEYYRTRTGHKIAMPVYWRNKIYSEEERERLWIEKLDKGERYVNGIKIDIKDGEENYFAALKEAQDLNKELGYGDGYEDGWKQKEYENERRNMMRRERINKTIPPEG